VKNKSTTMILIGVFIAIAIYIALCSCSTTKVVEYSKNLNLSLTNKDWKGNVVIDKKYQNDETKASAPFLDVVKWKLSSNPQKEEKKSENYSLSVEYIYDFSDNRDKIVWLGHATFLIQLGGIRIITDPVFGNIPSAKRKAPFPCNTDSLRNIDYLLISHDHRDHFDKKSIELLSQNNPDIQALTPLGSARLFKSKRLKNIPLQQAGWYQEYIIENDIRIIFLPTKHWGRRSLNDFNKTLWGSFLIIKGNTKVFFAGDSAYDNIFKDIHNLFGDIDICILPIGAYSPEFIMASSHMNPEEALKVFNDLKGNILIPMHYGTFDLSDEPLGEPIKRLKTAIEDSGQVEKLVELSIGGQYFIEKSENETE